MAKEISKLFVTLGLDDKEFTTKIDKVQKQLTQAGKIMTGIGAAIVGSFALVTKEWADAGDAIQEMAQRTGFSTEALSELRHAAELSGASVENLETASRTLSGAITDAGAGLATYVRALDRIGLKYDDLKGKNPEDQFMSVMEALANLKDETLKAATAQDLFGRAGTSLLPMLANGKAGLDAMRKEARDLGIVFSKDAADSASDLRDAIANVKNAAAGFGAVIAQTLAPIITDIAKRVIEFVGKLKQWMDAHPGLSKAIITITAAIGGLMAVVGPFLLMLPMISALFTAMLGPIGLVIIAVAVLAAGAALLIMNWDKVTAFFSKAWSQIKSFFLQGIYNILDNLSKFTRFIPGLNSAVDSAKEHISNMIDAEKIGQEAEAAKRNIEALATEQKRLAQEATTAKKTELEKQAADAKLTSDKEIDQLRKTYGVLKGYDKDYQETRMDAARKASEERGKQIERELNSERKAYDERIRMIDAESAFRMKFIDDEAAAQIAGLNGQINGIRKEQDADDKARRDKENAERKAELQKAVDDAENGEQFARAKKALNEFLTQMETDRLREERDAQIASIQGQIEDVRKAAQDQKDVLQTEIEARKEAEKKKLEASMATLQAEKEGLDAALQDELIRLEKERLAAEDASNQRLAKTLGRLEAEKNALDTQLINELAKIQQHVKNVNDSTAKLQSRTVTITTVHQDTYNSEPSPFLSNPATGYFPEMKKYAKGGPIPEPTLLYGLRSKAPYGIAGEAGQEWITPEGMGPRMMTIIQTLDGRELSRSIMPYAAGEIRLRTGLR